MISENPAPRRLKSLLLTPQAPAKSQDENPPLSARACPHFLTTFFDRTYGIGYGRSQRVVEVYERGSSATPRCYGACHGNRENCLTRTFRKNRQSPKDGRTQNLVSPDQVGLRWPCSWRETGSAGHLPHRPRAGQESPGGCEREVKTIGFLVLSFISNTRPSTRPCSPFSPLPNPVF